jgi:hypothetical protein
MSLNLEINIEKRGGIPPLFSTNLKAMRNKPILNGVAIAIFATSTFLMSGCVNDNQPIKSISNQNIDDLIVKVETICLDYQSKDVILSLKIRNDTLKNDYNFRYLGVLKVKKKNFDVLERYIFSGQELDSQRANGSIMLFYNKKLYGEYIGLDNNYSVGVSSHKIILFNKETKNTTEFEILDSIPSQLFIPYSCADSICQGDILYMNKMDE